MREYEPYDNDTDDVCDFPDCWEPATHIMDEKVACTKHADEHNEEVNAGHPDKYDWEDAKGDAILDEERGK